MTLRWFKVEGGFNLFMIEYLRFSSRKKAYHKIMKKYEITMACMGSTCSNAGIKLRKSPNYAFLT